METQEMRQAMNTLRQFSEKEKNYFAYQARQDFIRQQNSIRLDYESVIQQERSEKEAAIQREQKALAEIERLTALLKNQ